MADFLSTFFLAASFVLIVIIGIVQIGMAL